MSLKISKKKFVYLISPNKIPNSFYKNLKLVFKTKKVSFFQLRLKNYSLKKKIIIGKKIKNICKKYKVKFIINDDPLLALKLDADGCHLGQKDMNIYIAKKILGKKIIGITCHNSMNLAKKAIKAKADYIAFGAFNQSKTKKTKHVASVKILNKVKKEKINLYKDFYVFTGSTVGVVPFKGKGLYKGTIDKIGSVSVNIR